MWFAVPGTKNEFWMEGKVEEIAMPTDIMFKPFTNRCGRLLLKVFSWLNLYRNFFLHIVATSILG